MERKGGKEPEMERVNFQEEPPTTSSSFPASGNGQVTDRICLLQKISRGFPGILKCGGLRAQPVTTTRDAAKRMDLN